MTLFDWLFKAPAALHGQTTAPLYNERLAVGVEWKQQLRYIEQERDTLLASADALTSFTSFSSRNFL